MCEKIFISIAAYCDSELENTIRSALESASKPDSLVFGIVNQAEQPLNLSHISADIRVINVAVSESYGVSWARAVAQTLYDNEDYYLQLDSHMWFEPNWDTLLITTLKKLPVMSIISAYPYGYEIVNGKPQKSVFVSPKTTLVIRPHKNQILTSDNYTLTFESRHLFVRDTVLGCHIAGGFLFTHGLFVEDVPYDAQYYFHGEEQGLAIRAYTRGWDIYHIPHIPLYHLYKTPNKDYKEHHWHPVWQRDAKQIQHLQDRARNRLVGLVNGDLIGAYGLGDRRSVRDFANFSGLDYRNLEIFEPEHYAGLLA
jgi:hypothetical protein